MATFHSNNWNNTYYSRVVHTIPCKNDNVKLKVNICIIFVLRRYICRQSIKTAILTQVL